MVQSYISLLDILYNDIQQRRDYPYLIHIRTIQETKHYPVGTPPFIIALVDDWDNNLRQICMQRQLPRTTLMQGDTFQLPPFLEYILLEQSDMGYTKEELDYIEQSMLRYLMTWCQLRCVGAMRAKPFAILKEHNLVQNFDLENYSDAAKNYVTSVYRRMLTPFQLSPPEHRIYYHNALPMTPVSTSDVFQMFRLMTPLEPMPTDPILLPMLAVYSLLGQETTAYQQMTYHDYVAYKGQLPKQMQDQLYHETEPTDQPFSYGFDTGIIQQKEVVARDSQLINKTLCYLFDTMRKQAVNKNPVVCSEATISHIRPTDTNRISVRLNRRELSWEQTT